MSIKLCLTAKNVLNFKRRFFMKKIKLLALFVAAAALCFAFACCAAPNDLTGNAKVVLAGDEQQVFDVDLAQAKLKENSTVKDLLQYLRQEKGLEFSMSGTMLTSVGSLVPKGNQFVAFYHNVQADADVTIDPITYDGTTLYSSGLGISSQKLQSGMIVYFAVITF